MLLVVQKSFAIFAILFGIAAGFYRPGSKDPARPNNNSGREGPDPRQNAKWAEKRKTPAWFNPPPSPYGHYCIGLNKHIKDGDEIFHHYQLMFF